MSAWCADDDCDDLSDAIAVERESTCTRPAVWLLWRCEDTGTAWSLYTSADADAEVVDSLTRFFADTGSLVGVEQTGAVSCGEDMASTTIFGDRAGCVQTWCLYEPCDGGDAWPGLDPTCNPGADP